MNRSSSCSHSRSQLFSILHGRPQAVASVAGNINYPDITGAVRFYQSNEGVLILAEISGLPQSNAPCEERVFGFHIHEGTDCSGNMDDPFADVMSHYDPGNCGHPYHAGDLPPLFGNSGRALSLFLTNRFSIDEIIERTVIIHDLPDNFKTQPSIYTFRFDAHAGNFKSAPGCFDPVRSLFFYLNFTPPYHYELMRSSSAQSSAFFSASSNASRVSGLKSTAWAPIL